jgi:hypothetical protein
MAYYETETVRVKADNPQGFALINKADYDESAHELFEGLPPAQAPGHTALGGGDDDEEVRYRVLPGFDLTTVVKADVAAVLAAAGYSDPAKVYFATVAELVEFQGVGERIAEKLKESAADFVEVLGDEGGEGEGQ